jgi:hypothetical protein
MYKIIDNFLSQKDFKNIKTQLVNSQFPWKCADISVDEKESLPTTASYYFMHDFWNGFYVEPQSTIFCPIIYKINCKSIIRIKANLYPCTDNIEYHPKHVDYEFPHKCAIFYLNTNNSITILENEIEIKSKENRLLLFDSSKTYKITTCSDNKCRIDVIFNYF